MNIDIQNIHSPCTKCYIHGHPFSEEDEHCKHCEYNVAIYVLKKVLKANDFCQHCAYKKYMGGGYFDCHKDYGTMNCEDFVIDWESVIREYNI